MGNTDKTKEELIKELAALRRRVAELEKSETERKQAEQSERLLATVMRDSNDAITVQDFSGNIIGWNHGAEQMYGYTEAEALKMNIRETVPQAERKDATTFIKQLSQGETIESFESQRLTKDGRILDVWLTVTKLVDDSGKPIGFSTTERDITARKKAEQTLQESEEKLRQTFGSIADGIAVTDFNGVILDVNDRLVKIHGFRSKDELLGKSGLELVAQRDRERAREGMQRTIEQGLAEGARYTLVRADGTEFPGEVSGSVLRDVSGNPVGFVTISRDITERKQAEERIEHLTAVLRAIRSVNQLIVREKDRDRLLQGACDSLIETRGYYNAWIALLDESGKLLTYAEAGLGKDFLPMGERLKGGELTHCGQRALAQSGVVVTEDPLSTCGDCPLAKKYHGRRAMTIRLEYDEKVYGLLVTSLPPEFAADEEEQSLFREVTGDIAFALHAMELEEERKQAEEALRERVKELQCLYSITSVAARPGITFDELYQEIVDLLSVSWQYPEITCARITIDGREFKTENCRDTEWEQSSDIKVHGVKAGKVEVAYLEERPELDEGPFLKEERLLLNAVAERLGGITEHKQAEEALRGSEERFRALAENTSDWIWETNTDGIYIYVSPKIKDILGYEPEEVIGKTPFDLMLTEEAKRISGKFRAIVKSQRPFERLENTNLHKNGRVVILETSGVPYFDVEGHFCGYRGIDRDITERKRAEEKARELEVLRELDRLRSGLLANISHELRTPLTSIKGFANTLLRSDVKWSEEDQQDFLQSIDQESDRLIRLINDLLDMSRLEAGGLNLEKHDYQISEILDSISERLTSLTEHHKLGVAVPLELPLVFVDEMRIGQVLTNLVENAAKFSRQGSLITIAAELSGDQVIISVTDEGEGIAPEFIPRVFDRFYQAESIVAGRKSGTGLGLSICRGIIESHRGKIWVESTLGKGSKFSFSLPVSRRGT